MYRCQSYCRQQSFPGNLKIDQNVSKRLVVDDTMSFRELYYASSARLMHLDYHGLYTSEYANGEIT